MSERRPVPDRPQGRRSTQVLGDEARAMIARRVEADLSLVFADVAVVFNGDGQVEVRTTEWGGVAALTIDRDDQLSERDVEAATASVTEDIVDNLWPDSEVPWPPCPSHRDHPLQPRLIRGRACWICLRGDDIEIPIGRLGTP